MAVEATGQSLGAIEIGLSAAVKRDGSRPLPRGPSRRRGGHVDDFGPGHPPGIGGGHRSRQPETLAKLAAKQAQRGRLGCVDTRVAADCEQALGPVHVKGREAPIEIYRLA